MNYTKSLRGSLAALAVGACAFAQSSTPETGPAGLLGQRYFGAGLFLDDLHDMPVDSGLGGELAVNLPITTSLDLGLAYSYERLDDSLLDLRSNTAGVTLRAHNPYENMKLFSDATLGYAWNSVRVPGFSRQRLNDGFWALGVGLEVPFARNTAFTGRVAYNDAFDSDSDGYWSFSGGVNHRFTATVDGIASITVEENDAIVYGLGIAVRF